MGQLMCQENYFTQLTVRLNKTGTYFWEIALHDRNGYVPGIAMDHSIGRSIEAC